MFVKFVNDCTGPDGFVQTLLVFRCVPRIVLLAKSPAPSTAETWSAHRMATAEISKYFARRQVRGALNAWNRRNVTDIHSTPIELPVLVYHSEKNEWEGPFSRLDIEEKDVMLLTLKKSSEI